MALRDDVTKDIHKFDIAPEEILSKIINRLVDEIERLERKITDSAIPERQQE